MHWHAEKMGTIVPTKKDHLGKLRHVKGLL